MGQAYKPQPSALIVGQNFDQRDLVGMLLEECDLKVIDCESAEAAVLVLSAMGEAVRIVFTTVDLPGSGDGVTLAREVGERWPHVRVVALTADAPDDLKRKLPRKVIRMQNPRPLDILVQAGKAIDTPRRH